MNVVRFQGERLDVYYEFDKDSAPLGEGGMGRIYQGYRVDTTYNLQSIVAIKCIRPELAGNQSIIQRAQREAAVQLDHPNLLRMYGFFSGAEFSQYSGSYTPTHYLAMERLVGVNLDEVLFKGTTTDKSGMPVQLAEDVARLYAEDRVSASVEIMKSVLTGIAFLHQCGYIHRDMDPSNVMLTQEGNTKVIDYGVSKRIVASTEGGGLTQAGQFLGKVSYAAPELILGDLRSQGPATDLYALGIMLFQMVTGYLPVNGTDQEIMDAHLKGRIPYNEISNKSLRKVIEKATAPEIAKRYFSAEEFLAALSTVDVSAKSSPANTPSDKASSKKRSSTQTSYASQRKPLNVPNWIIPASAGAGVLAGCLLEIVTKL